MARIYGGYVNIVSEKRQKLKELKAQSDMATEQIARSISCLELTDSEIADTTREVEGYIMQLVDIRNTLKDQLTENTDLIRRYIEAFSSNEEQLQDVESTVENG